jgi:hypothetical protein
MGDNMTDTSIEEYEGLLVAQKRIIHQQEEQIELLGRLEEGHRLHLMAQSQELAERRQFSEAFEHPAQAVVWLLLKDIWPFSLWYGRHK